MNQLAMNFEAPTRPRSRLSDPSTSVKAAKRSEAFSMSHKELILQALATHGQLAPCQMFEFTGLTTTQADRRRKEMVEARLIRIVPGAEVQGCEVWVLSHA